MILIGGVALGDTPQFCIGYFAPALEDIGLKILRLKFVGVSIV